MPINLDILLMDPRGRGVKRHRTPEEIAAAKAAAPPLEEGEKEPDYSQVLVDMTIAEACVDALLDHGLVDPATGKPKLTGAEKFARFQLVEKIKRNEGAVPLNTAEIAMLEAVTGEAFLPAVVGAIWTALRSPV